MWLASRAHVETKALVLEALGVATSPVTEVGTRTGAPHGGGALAVDTVLPATDSLVAGTVGTPSSAARRFLNSS